MIRYIGNWPDHSGYGEANRNIILSLHTAGVPLSTERLEQTTRQAEYGKAFQIALQLEHEDKDHRIRIIHLTPNWYVKYLDPGKYHIGHLFWETDRIPKLWVWNCNKMDEIWTGCEKQKKALIDSGVKVPIFVFPQPAQALNNKVTPYLIPHFNGFLFYSIFEWIERKNPQALLKAFYNEFTRDEEVGLLIKSYRNSFAADNQQFIRSAINKLKPTDKKAARVFLYEDLLSEHDMYRLHASGDCFISTSRGEGWNRPQTEAMLMGKPTISGAVGGVTSYLPEETYFEVKHTKEPIILDSFSESYESDQNWNEIDIADLQDKMRFVFNNRKEADIVGKAGQKFVLDNFNMLKIGTMMKERLDKINLELL